MTSSEKKMALPPEFEFEARKWVGEVKSFLEALLARVKDPVGSGESVEEFVTNAYLPMSEEFLKKYPNAHPEMGLGQMVRRGRRLLDIWPWPEKPT